jgi:hypothetical protein
LIGTGGRLSKTVIIEMQQLEEHRKGLKQEPGELLRQRVHQEEVCTEGEKNSN